MTAQEYRSMKVKKPSKYRNKKCVYDGKTFDSLKEKNRYITLSLMQKSGLITDLKCQVPFKLSVCKFLADFTYLENGELKVVDVKSAITKKNPVYRLKKKMMEKELGITIIEI